MKSFLTAFLISIFPIFATAATPSLQGIIDLVRAGKYDAARAMHDKLPHAPIDEVFLEAQIFTAKGQIADAITAYRAILTARPDLIPARQLLARLLFSIGDWDAARFQYRTLFDATSNRAQRAQYAKILGEIQRRIPSGYTTTFTLTPSSNINRGTGNNEIFLGAPLIDEQVEQSGVGAQLGLGAFYRIPQGETAVLVFNAQAFYTHYSQDVFNIMQPRLSVAYENTTPKQMTRFALTAERVLRKRESSYTILSFDHSGRRALEGPNTLTWSAGVRQFDFDHSPAQDGPEFNMRLGLQRQMSPTLSLIGGIGLGRGVPESEVFRYYRLSANLGVSKNWQGGWATFAGLEIGSRQYDAKFPTLPDNRADTYWSLRGTVLNSTISYQGFAPRVNCLYLRNTSNVGFYDYTTLECGVQLTREY